MAFDAEAVLDLYSVIETAAMGSGLFENTTTHEPKTAPGNGLSCAVWVSGIKPVQSSGLNSTSGLVSFFIRIYNPMLAEPQDDIDPNILTAVTTLLGIYSGDFDFGEVASVRNIDLLGQYGDGMAAEAGYMEISNKMFRVMVINLPIIVNDLWVQGSGAE